VGFCGTRAPTVVANVTGPISGSTNQPLGLAAQLDAKGSQSPDDYRSVVGAVTQLYPNGCGLTLPLSYQWTIATSPAASIASLSSATLSNPSFVPDLPGGYQVRMTASDGKNSATATVTVNGVGGYRSTPATTGAVFTATVTEPGTGRPIVAWWDNSNGTVAAAKCTSNCNGANPIWTLLGGVNVDTGLAAMTLPSQEEEPRPVAVAAAGSNIFVAYHTSSAATTTVGAHSRATCGAALAVFNGTTWATYQDIAPTTSTSITCDAGGTAGVSAGRWLAIDASSAVPVMTYSVVKAPNQSEPHFRSCADAACASLTGLNTDVAVVTSSAGILFGRWNNVHVDPSGAVGISYYGDNGSTRGVAYTSATTIAAANTTIFSYSFPDFNSNASSDVARFLSMATDALGASRFFVYRDTINRTAKYLRCGLASTGICSFTVPALIADAASSDYGRGTAAAYDPNGFPRVAYFDVTNGKVRVLAHDNQSGFNKTAELDGNKSTSTPFTPVGLSMAFGPTGSPVLNLAYDAPTPPALKFFAGP
jgi:hypothetical protein